MSSLALLFLLFTPQLFAMNIIHNSRYMRLVGSSSNCSRGRVEFYDGTSWGPFANCGYSSVSSSSSFATSICASLGWSSYVSYYTGQTNYLYWNTESSTEYFLNNYTAYVYNEYDSCDSSSCYSGTSDICGDCSLYYNSSLCSTSKYSSYQSSIINSYAFYVKCSTSSSSSKYTCYPYSSYDYFDSSWTSFYDCDSYFTCDSYLSVTWGAIVGWTVFVCFIFICCIFCCICQRRRFATYGYYGWGSRRYGGTYGWGGGHRGVTPAFAAGYNAGGAGQTQQTTTTTVVQQTRVPIAMQGQQPVTMPGEPAVQYVQQPMQVQYVQQPIQGQQVQYIQQPIQGQQVQYIQQPMQGQPQIQYIQQPIQGQQLEMQQIQQPVQYQQQGQPQVVMMASGGGAGPGGYPVLQGASAPPDYSEVVLNEGK